MFEPESHETMVSVGSLPAGITALRRLKHLGLGNCLTAPLTHSISRLTGLTSLEISQDDLEAACIAEELTIEAR